MCSGGDGTTVDVVFSGTDSTEPEVVSVDEDSDEADGPRSDRKRGRYRSQGRGRLMASSRANQSCR